MEKEKAKKKNRMSFKTFWHQVKINRACYVMIAPYVILFFIFTVAPVVISIFLSFTSFNMLEAPKFVGLQNYIRLFFGDRIFIEKAIPNTFIIASIVGPGGYILCLILAWMLNELPRYVRMLLTLLFYAPSISGNAYVIFTYMFSNDANGLANALLTKWGFISDPILWFKDEKTMMTLVIFISLWMSIGTTFLSFIAGLQGIPKHLYEAAAIDGIKNRWQELYYVTLPSMKPQLMFGAVMSITGAFGCGGVITALCGLPSTNYAVHTIMNHLSDYGSTRYEMGYASAIATLLFLVMIGANKVIQKLLSKVGE